MLHNLRNDADQKVSLSNADLEALRRLLRLIENSQEPETEASEIPFSLGPNTSLIQVARLLIQMRRRRTRQFNPSMFGEPAWDMLLVLYANYPDGTRLTVGRLSELAGSAASTAIRWLDYLVREQFVFRRENPLDARSAFVELTDKGRSTLETYLSETLDLLRQVSI